VELLPRLLLKIHILSILSIVLSQLACAPSEAADPQFAYFVAEQSVSGPLGRILANGKGFTTNFQEIKVCVESDSQSFGGRELLLETKLAYAAWLSLENSFTAADFQAINFSLQSSCDPQREGVSSLVKLVDHASLQSQVRTVFKSGEIRCEVRGRFKSCRGSPITLGLGGPGVVAGWYLTSNPERWTKIEAMKPSTVHLSPFVDFLSLAQDIAKNEDLSEALRDHLVDRYAVLLNQPSHTLGQLDSFNQALAENDVIGQGDYAFEDLAQEFYEGREDTLRKAYRPKKAAYSTLLHEVGHQMGLDHADHPSADSVTDGSEPTVEAAMAYGLPYFHLKEDDRRGMQANAREVHVLLDKRR
jgi:hypothetical protein